MYLFNKQEQLINVKGEHDFTEIHLVEKINTASQLTFSVVNPIAQNIQKVCVPAPRGAGFLMFKIITEDIKNDHIEYTCVESAYDELASYGYIRDLRPSSRSAEYILKEVLKETRWRLGTVYNTNNVSTNFYYEPILNCIQDVVSLFDLELTFTVAITGNKIVKRQVNMYSQQGERTGKRFEYGSNALEVEQETSTDELYTALVGRGKGEEVEGDHSDGSPTGYGRRITFADVVWKKSNGDALDKPKGQEYLEDPEATKLYGFADGSPRIGIVTFEDDTDEKLLLYHTYEKLLELERPQVQFKASVLDVGDLGLGDTVAIIRHDFHIEYFTRVFKVDHDLLDKNNNTIELGDDLSGNDIGSQVNDISNSISSMHQQISYVMAGASSDNQKVTYSPDQPADGSLGDLWYKDLGNGQTEMYIYNDGWQLVVDSSGTNQEVLDKVDQAMQEMADKEKEINGKLESNQIDISQAQKDLEQVKQDTANQLADIRDSVVKDVADVKAQSKDALDKANSIDGKASQALENATDAKETAITVATDIDSVRGELSSKADKSTVDTINQTVSDQGTKITQNANDIKSKASSSDVDKLSGRVSTAETTLLQTAQGLTGKADSSQLNKLSGDLTTLSNNFSTTSAGFQSSLTKITNTVDTNKTNTDKSISDTNKQLSVAKADIKATADNLSTNYTKTTDEHNYVNSQIKESADKINLSVASVSDKVDGMEIGGRNYLNNTNDITLTNVKNYADWILTSGGSGVGSVIDVTGVPASHGFRIMNNNEGNRDWQQYVKWGKNNYIFSVYARLAGDSKSVRLLIRTGDDDGSGELFSEVKGLSNNSWTRFTFAIDATKYDISHKISMQFGLQGVGSVDFAAPQLERGTKVTDYGPAPEDTDSKIAALQIVDDQIKSTVSNKADTSYVDQKANQITSTVGKQFDNLQIGGRNYLLGTGTFVGLKGDGTHQATADRAYTLSDKGYIRGKTMTFSVNVSKTEGTTGGQVAVNIGTTWQRVLTINIADIPVGAGKRFSRTIVVQDKENRGDVYFQTPDSLLNGTLTFSQAMFAIGDKAIDYAPAPEDDRQGINDNKNAISKVDQKADSISSTVTNNQNANNAKFSSLEQNLNGFKSTVYSKSDVDNKVNTINGNVNKKADSSDVNNQLSKKADVSQITQLSDRINLKVSQTDFDNMQIGGRNYLLGTANSKTMTGDGTHQVTADRAYLFSDKEYIRGKQMVLSFNVTKTEGTVGGKINVLIGGTWQFITAVSVSDIPVGTIKRITVSVTPNDAVNRGDVYFQTPGKLLNGSVIISEPMLVEGNKAIDYAPAPEELTTADNVVSQINIDKSGVLIQGKKIMIDGDTYIKNGVIKSAMIDTLDANKITTGTLNAANVNIINMNVNKLVGNTTSFVQSAWNGISSYVNITPDGIDIGLWDASVSLKSDGMHIYDDFNGEDLGLIHGNNIVGYDNINGLTFDLNRQADYMAWGARNDDVSTYDTKLIWSKANKGSLIKGFSFNDTVTFQDEIRMSNSNTALKFETIYYKNIDYASLVNARGGEQSGILFGGKNLYIMLYNTVYSIHGMKIPTKIGSDGTVQSWWNL